MLSANVQMQLYGAYELSSYAGVGFQENEVGTMTVQVNGQADTNKSDFHVLINWGDGASSAGDLVYQRTSDGQAEYLIKGSHVYQTPTSGLPVTFTVNGPDGTSVSLRSNDLDQADVASMPSGITVNQPTATPKAIPPADVQIQLFGGGNLTSYAGVGFQENPIGTMRVQVNGQSDPTLSDFHAQINWGDSSSWTPGDLVYQGTSQGIASYLIKGSHVYHTPGTGVPIVVYVTGPDGTSTAFRPNDIDSADIVPMPSGIPGVQPSAIARSMSPAEVEIQTFGGYQLSSYAGVGFQENALGTINVQVNGQADQSVSDFHVQINWGDSSSWTSGDLVYQGTSQGISSYLIKGSHIYHTPGTGIPIVVYVTGPDGTSATFRPNDVDTANVAPNPHPINIGNLSPSQWIVNKPSYLGTITVSGGSGTYSGLQISGLPEGLNGSLSGGTIDIRGTPTRPGTFRFSATVHDSDGTQASKQYTLTITDTAITLGSLNPSRWEQNESGYEGAITISGGVMRYTNLVVTGLPAGLIASIESSVITVNGIPKLSGMIFITGTPTQSGTFTIRVSVSDDTSTAHALAMKLPGADNGNGQASATYQLTVVAAPRVGPLSHLSTIAGKAHFTMSVSGGTAPYVLSSITGLPAGLKATLSGSTIIISGNTTKIGSFNCVVNLTDTKDVKLGNPSFVMKINATVIGQGDGIDQGNGAEDNLAENIALSTALAKAAQASGGLLTEAELRIIVSIESTANANVGTNSGGYTGLFQLGKALFSPTPFKGCTYTYKQVQTSWQANINCGVEYLKYTIQQLTALHVPVTPLNIYLAHQQGPTGCKNLLQLISNPATRSTLASSNELSNSGNLKSYIPSNKITVGDYYDYWAAKFAAENAIVNGAPAP